MSSIFPWEGESCVKPRNFRSTVCIPCRDTPEQVFTAVKMWRMQTVPPFIMVIDTGSKPENLLNFKSIAGDDLEVHHLSPNGMNHPSDLPAVACDLAVSMCRTRHLILTHSDVFPRRQDLVERLIDYPEPVVGYGLSGPRPYPVGEKWVDHCLLRLDLGKIGDKDLCFSQRRICQIKKIPHGEVRNWMPDTTIMFNTCLDRQNIEVRLIGRDRLHEDYFDDNISHVKNLTNSQNNEVSERRKAHVVSKNHMIEAEKMISSWKVFGKPHLTVVTPCYRLRGLKVISGEIEKLKEFFDVKWVIGVDASKISVNDVGFGDAVFKVDKSVFGAQQKNTGMKLAMEWVFFLDDDNMIHRHFGKQLAHHIRQYPGKKCFVFDQLHPTGHLRLPAKEGFQIGEIDTGNFVIHQDIIGSSEWKEDSYANDYYFLSDVYDRHRDKFVFSPEAVTYYNGLSRVR